STARKLGNDSSERGATSCSRSWSTTGLAGQREVLSSALRVFGTTSKLGAAAIMNTGRSPVASSKSATSIATTRDGGRGYLLLNPRARPAGSPHLASDRATGDDGWCGRI